MRRVRLFILSSAVHIHSRLLTIGRNRRCTDVSACNLRALKLEALHLRHVVAQTAICNVTGDGAGCVRRSGCHRRNGVTVQSSTISCGNTTEGTSHKAGASSEAHPLTALNDSIADIRVGTKSVCKALRKASCSCTGSGCNATACSAKHTAGTASHTAADTGDYTSCHQQLHSHATAGLSYIQTDRSQITVKLLCSLQIGDRAEQPKEDATFSCRKSATVGDVLAHRGSKASQEPNIHHQQQELGTNHATPRLEHRVCCLGCAHAERQRRCVAQNTNYDVPFNRLQKELEVVPTQCDLQDQNQDHTHHTGHRYD